MVSVGSSGNQRGWRSRNPGTLCFSSYIWALNWILFTLFAVLCYIHWYLHVHWHICQSRESLVKFLILYSDVLVEMRLPWLWLKRSVLLFIRSFFVLCLLVELIIRVSLDDYGVSLLCFEHLFWISCGWIFTSLLMYWSNVYKLEFVFLSSYRFSRVYTRMHQTIFTLVLISQCWLRFVMFASLSLRSSLVGYALLDL
jgi:hypothetical protein